MRFHGQCSFDYFWSRLLLYSVGSGVNRVQVVLSGFIVRLFCVFFRQNLYVDRVVCISWLHSCLCVCRCDGEVICVGHDLNWCSWWWYVFSVNVEKCW